ncbi:MAG: hypothetical protein HYR84_15830 [Planctomycetes bacterium]|nr:hypothetical protein [Planctomycetota bacterium]
MAPPGNRNPGSGFGGPRYPGTFLLALREALAKLNWQPVAWKGGSVECVDAAGLSQQIGLENMYRRLRREPRERWPELLAEILGSITPDVANPPDDLNGVADRLLVRLGPAFSRMDAELDVWHRPLAGDNVMAFLVIDYPSSMSYVTQKMIAGSEEDADHWYQRALSNLRERTQADCLQVVHDESGLLQSQAGDAYDSSRGLILDHLVPGHEEDGFYVIVPGRDHLLTLPLMAQTMMMAPWLRAGAAKMYREIPYPISPELFWVCGGVWHPFVIESEGDDLIVKPPAAFLDVMHRLRPELGEDDPSEDSRDDPDDAPPPFNDGGPMLA